jgi:hypothetical protein
LKKSGSKWKLPSNGKSPPFKPGENLPSAYRFAELTREVFYGNDADEART